MTAAETTSAYRFKGYLIEQGEDGWSCDQLNLGYADTAAEIEDEITDYIAEETEHYRDINTPLDTPSLGAPWWAHR